MPQHALEDLLRQFSQLPPETLRPGVHVSERSEELRLFEAVIPPNLLLGCNFQNLDHPARITRGCSRKGELVELHVRVINGTCTDIKVHYDTKSGRFTVSSNDHVLESPPTTVESLTHLIATTAGVPI